MGLRLFGPQYRPCRVEYAGNANQTKSDRRQKHAVEISEQEVEEQEVRLAEKSDETC